MTKSSERQSGRESPVDLRIALPPHRVQSDSFLVPLTRRSKYALASHAQVQTPPTNGQQVGNNARFSDELYGGNSSDQTTTTTATSAAAVGASWNAERGAIKQPLRRYFAPLAAASNTSTPKPKRKVAAAAASQNSRTSATSAERITIKSPRSRTPSKRKSLKSAGARTIGQISYGSTYHRPSDSNFYSQLIFNKDKFAGFKYLLSKQFFSPITCVVIWISFLLIYSIISFGPRMSHVILHYLKTPPISRNIEQREFQNDKRIEDLSKIIDELNRRLSTMEEIINKKQQTEFNKIDFARRIDWFSLRNGARVKTYKFPSKYSKILGKYFVAKSFLLRLFPIYTMHSHRDTILDSLSANCLPISITPDNIGSNSLSIQTIRRVHPKIFKIEFDFLYIDSELIKTKFPEKSDVSIKINIKASKSDDRVGIQAVDTSFRALIDNKGNKIKRNLQRTFNFSFPGLESKEYNEYHSYDIFSIEFTLDKTNEDSNHDIKPLLCIHKLYLYSDDANF